MSNFNRKASENSELEAILQKRSGVVGNRRDTPWPQRTSKPKEKLKQSSLDKSSEEKERHSEKKYQDRDIDRLFKARRKNN